MRGRKGAAQAASTTSRSNHRLPSATSDWPVLGDSGYGLQREDVEEDEAAECPLCIEPLDETDEQFQPCPCGYRVCLFCYDRIKLELKGLCPSCRTPYGEPQTNHLVQNGKSRPTSPTIRHISPHRPQPQPAVARPLTPPRLPPSNFPPASANTSQHPLPTVTAAGKSSRLPTLVPATSLPHPLHNLPGLFGPPPAIPPVPSSSASALGKQSVWGNATKARFIGVPEPSSRQSSSAAPWASYSGTSSSAGTSPGSAAHSAWGVNGISSSTTAALTAGSFTSLLSSSPSRCTPSLSPLPGMSPRGTIQFAHSSNRPLPLAPIPSKPLSVVPHFPPPAMAALPSASSAAGRTNPWGRGMDGVVGSPGPDYPCPPQQGQLQKPALRSQPSGVFIKPSPSDEVKTNEHQGLGGSEKLAVAPVLEAANHRGEESPGRDSEATLAPSNPWGLDEKTGEGGEPGGGRAESPAGDTLKSDASSSAFPAVPCGEAQSGHAATQLADKMSLDSQRSVESNTLRQLGSTSWPISSPAFEQESTSESIPVATAGTVYATNGCLIPEDRPSGHPLGGHATSAVWDGVTRGRLLGPVGRPCTSAATSAAIGVANQTFKWGTHVADAAGLESTLWALGLDTAEHAGAPRSDENVHQRASLARAIQSDGIPWGRANLEADRREETGVWNKSQGRSQYSSCSGEGDAVASLLQRLATASQNSGWSADGLRRASDMVDARNGQAHLRQGTFPPGQEQSLGRDAQGQEADANQGEDGEERYVDLEGFAEGAGMVDEEGSGYGQRAKAYSARDPELRGLGSGGVRLEESDQRRIDGSLARPTDLWARVADGEGSARSSISTDLRREMMLLGPSHTIPSGMQLDAVASFRQMAQLSAYVPLLGTKVPRSNSRFSGGLEEAWPEEFFQDEKPHETSSRNFSSNNSRVFFNGIKLCEERPSYSQSHFQGTDASLSSPAAQILRPGLDGNFWETDQARSPSLGLLKQQQGHLLARSLSGGSGQVAPPPGFAIGGNKFAPDWNEQSCLPGNSTGGSRYSSGAGASVWGAIARPLPSQQLAGTSETAQLRRHDVTAGEGGDWGAHRDRSFGGSTLRKEDPSAALGLEATGAHDTRNGPGEGGSGGGRIGSSDNPGALLPPPGFVHGRMLESRERGHLGGVPSASGEGQGWSAGANGHAFDGSRNEPSSAGVNFGLYTGTRVPVPHRPALGQVASSPFSSSTLGGGMRPGPWGRGQPAIGSGRPPTVVSGVRSQPNHPHAPDSHMALDSFLVKSFGRESHLPPRDKPRDRFDAYAGPSAPKSQSSDSSGHYFRINSSLGISAWQDDNAWDADVAQDRQRGGQLMCPVCQAYSASTLGQLNDHVDLCLRAASILE